jgi:hypothetical protein
MSKSGDDRAKNAHSGEPIESAGDLYAPDTSDGGSGDISEPAKVTLRSYLKSLTAGDGPQGREGSTANSKQPPDEGLTNSEGAGLTVASLAATRGVSSGFSALNGRDTWVVGHKSGAAPTRDPFGGILGALKAIYPLGRHIPAVDVESQKSRPGTIESSLSMDMGKAREKAETIGEGKALHKTAPTDAAAIGAEAYQDLHDAVSHALSYNRFSPTSGSPFVVDGEKQNVGWSFQRTLGHYDPNIEPVSGPKLAAVGEKLSYLQTGHKEGGNWATVLPTLTQMGLGSEIDLHDLHQVDKLITKARTQVYTLLDPRINDDVGNLDSYTSPLGTPMSIRGDKTYGVLNSFHEPFEGTLGLFLVVAIQLIALIVVGMLLELLYGQLFKPGLRTFDQQGLKGRELALGKNQPMDYGPGSFKSATLELIMWIFGYPANVQHSFGAAFMEGLMGFYGVDPDDIVTDPAGTFLSLWESTGFYAIVIRLVSQDMFDYPEIASAFDGKTDQVSALFKTFNIMKSSHTLKFIHTMVKLGDQILIYEDGVARNNMRQQMNPGNAMGAFMGAGSSGAMLLGSLRLKNLSNRFGGTQYGPTLGSSDIQLTADNEATFLANHMSGLAGVYRHGGKGAGQDNPPYIDTETRQRYERILDATFCPFYFHDLRTNEIVSFHAFLTNLNDSYQANFEDVTGFGRVEAAKIYQSTARSISLTFKVFAVTPEDMDAMYLKINRLVAMCYPQYTAGRAVELNGKIARAPYSQMPASTPLIRLRVGDIITTNASQLGLARLHGASEAESDAPANKGVVNGAGTSAFLDVGNPDGSSTYGLLRGHERVYFVSADVSHPSSFTVTDMISGIASWTKLANAPAAHPGPFRVEFDGTQETDSGINIYKIKKLTDSNNIEVPTDKFSEFIAGDASTASGKYLEEGWSGTHDVKRTPPAGSKEAGFFGGLEAGKGLIGIPVTDVETGPSADWANGAYNPKDDQPSTAHPYINVADGLDFTDMSKASSIIKSFTDSGGRGLPGVITSIDLGNFTDELTTWGIDKGYRGPRLLDVTISFSVIHEIVPGLDSNGQMNSAVYGIGSSKAYNKGEF